LQEEIPKSIFKENQKHYATIKERYQAIAPDLQGINAYRYARNITGGNQEFMEAVIFERYLEKQSLLPFAEAKTVVAQLGTEGSAIPLTESDYVLGVFDMTGELMRFAITVMATTGVLASGEPTSGEKTDRRNVLSDLREISSLLEGLNARHGSGMWRDMAGKMAVMQTCVEKVEKANYGMTVRGAERPKGWMPDLSDG
jgi:Translin family